MVALTDKELIRKFNIRPSDKILDIGGSSKQHDQIKIHTLVDIVRPEEAAYDFDSPLNATKFVRLDIETQRLPFKDNSFDFVLCTHTLEDLHSPFLVIEEMSRVAKRGYIATPSRGLDTTFFHFDITDWLTGPHRTPGFAHHKWLFENKRGVLHLTPKSYPLLYSTEFQFTRWTGPDECQFYWENKIKYKHDVNLDLNLHHLINNYRAYVKHNSKHLHKGLPLVFLDNPWYIFKAYLKLLLKRGQGFKV